jgi:acylphosphatase
VTQCIKCIVKGRVQGVWYRAGTQQRARELGLSGYARNLSDGGVEVLACGESEGLGELERWLWQGPPAAEVSEVECEPASAQAPDGFTTG